MSGDRTLESMRPMVASLPNDQKKQLAQQTLSELNAADPTSAQEAVQGAGVHLPRPGRRVTDILWFIIVWAFALVLVGSALTMMLSLFVPLATGASTTPILTLFTATVTFLGGLF